MPDETNPITREQWAEWMAGPCTQKLLHFVRGLAEGAGSRAETEKAQFPNESKANFYRADGEARAYGWVALAIMNLQKVAGEPVQPTGTEDTDKVGADGRRIHVQG